jgi:hypothetical protein
VRAWWVLVVVGAGCRFNFDELGLPCAAPVGHDEDGDGVDDACDGCPHIAETQPIDRDGDGVNDPCDPSPGSPRERIAAFDPFVTAGAGWEVGGTVTPSYTNDSFVVDTRTGILYLRRDQPAMPSGDVFELGGALGGQSGSEAKLSLVVESAAVPYYYCELQDLQASVGFDLAWTYNAVDYFTGDMHAMQEPLANGPFTITMAIAPPTVTCQTHWPPTANIPNPIPSGITQAGLAFQVYNLDVRIDYFIHIHSD